MLRSEIVLLAFTYGCVKNTMSYRICLTRTYPLIFYQTRPVFLSNNIHSFICKLVLFQVLALSNFTSALFFFFFLRVCVFCLPFFITQLHIFARAIWFIATKISYFLKKFLAKLEEIRRVKLDEFACIRKDLTARVQNVTEKKTGFVGSH